MQFLHWYRFYPSIWAAKFLCTECETHRFGSRIHSPPQIGVCLTDFPSTVPESVSCCMTWYTSCRWLAAPLIPCLPVCCSAQWDSLAGLHGHQLLPRCQAPRNLLPGVFPGCSSATLASFPPRTPTCGYVICTGPVHSFVLFIGKEETWEDGAIFKWSYAKLQSGFFCQSLMIWKICSHISSRLYQIFWKVICFFKHLFVLCCIWINVSEDCWFSGLLLSY